MASVRIVALLFAFVCVQVAVAPPPSESSGAEPQPAPQPQPSGKSDQGQEPAPKPAEPKQCAILVGESYSERKFQTGCKVCWSPPEVIKCEADGSWGAAESCPAGTKCQHTSECETTCVAKPAEPAPYVPSQGGSGM